MSKFKVGDRVRVVRTGAIGWEGKDWACVAYEYSGIPYPNGISIISHIDRDGDVRINGLGTHIHPDHFELVEEALTCEPIKTCTFYKPNTSIMSKVKTFVKNLTLSADEKLLRKHGLHDECGNTTSEGKDIISEMIYAKPENQAYLLEIAKGLEAEEKESK